jgi:hypothetical protein
MDVALRFVMAFVPVYELLGSDGHAERSGLASDNIARDGEVKKPSRRFPSARNTSAHVKSADVGTSGRASRLRFDGHRQSKRLRSERTTDHMLRIKTSVMRKSSV